MGVQAANRPPGYLEVAPVETHPVDLSSAGPGRVHPVDELLPVVEVYVDDVVQTLGITGGEGQRERELG